MGINFVGTVKRAGQRYPFKIEEAINTYERDWRRKLTHEERSVFAAGWYAGKAAL